MNKLHTQILKFKIGELLVGSINDRICLCDWYYRKMRKQFDERIQKGLNAEYITRNSGAIESTRLQLNEYFEGRRKGFDIPLKLTGTEFQINVWDKLRAIPYGKT